MKVNRNRGKTYQTEKTDNYKPALVVRGRCEFVKCESKGFLCSEIGNEHQEAILWRCYSLNSVTEQRHWIRMHIQSVPCSQSRTPSTRRKQTIKYYLPDEEGNELPVCQAMFLNTLDISQRTVRTVSSKTDDFGVMEGEKRGGRVGTLRQSDDKLRKSITAHIDRFPRMESHYCRKNSSRQYLNPELTIAKMHKMFEAESPEVQCSYTTYMRVFNSMNLTFHVPLRH